MNVDHLRGLTVHQVAAAEAVDHKVVLCPGARVYSFSLLVIGRDPVVLKLQDSQFEVREGYPLDMDVCPGIAWPAFARLIVPPLTAATLHIAYGNCA